MRFVGEKVVFLSFPLSDTHSDNYNIGSTTRNSLVEQLIGLPSMLAYYLTAKLEGKRIKVRHSCDLWARKSFFGLFHSDTHSDNYDIGSTTRNSLVEQLIDL
jgi:hypothetical protein